MTNNIEKTIANRLIVHAGLNGPDPGSYLRRYVAEHVAGAGIWDELAERVDVLDKLDPDALAAEAFRSYSGRKVLPAAIAVSMAARNGLRSTVSDERQLVRALMAARLEVNGHGLEHPSLRWCRLALIHLHLPVFGSTEGVEDVAFGRLSDGQVVLATGGRDGVVRLWDPAAGTRLGKPLVGHTLRVGAVEFGYLQDGRVRLVASGPDGFWVWDPDTGASVGRGRPFNIDSYAVNTIAFGRLRDGRVVLAAVYMPGLIRLCDPDTGAPIVKTFNQNGEKWVATLAFVQLSDERVLLATGGAAGLQLWDPTTGAEVGKPLNDSIVSTLAFERLQSGQLMLAAGGPDGLRLWNLNARIPSKLEVSNKADRINVLAFGRLPDGRTLLATGDASGVVHLWDPETGALTGEKLTGHSDGVRALAFGELQDGRVVLATGGSNGLQLWDPDIVTPPGEEPHRHTRAVDAMAFGRLPDGRTLLATGDRGGVVWFWDPVTGIPAGPKLASHSEQVQGMAFGRLPDGRVVLATGDRAGVLRLWSPDTGLAIWEKQTGHPTAGVGAIAFGKLPSGQMVLATAGWDGIRLWVPKSKYFGKAWRQIGELTGHNRGVNTIAFESLPNGRIMLATGGPDGVRLWGPRNRVSRWAFGDPPFRLLKQLGGHNRGMNVMAFGRSAHGRVFLATGDGSGVVRLWDPSVGKVVDGQLGGHAQGVRAMAIGRGSNGQTLLVTGDGDGVVRLWNAALSTVVLVRTWRITPSIPSVMHLEGSLLFVGCNDGVLALDVGVSPVDLADL